ncbi:MAG: PE-PPE domain-containing protein [Mycobacterium sp.]
MAAQRSVSGRRRSFKRSVATAAAVAAICTVLAPVAMESRTIATTLASYVIGVGGRGDGPSANIPNKLHGLDGFYNSPADTYVPVTYPGRMWPIDSLQDPTFAQSVMAGHTALNSEIAAHPGENITIVGYSLGAVVVNESRKNLNEQYPDGNPNIQFLTISNAYKPNGGILARFPGIYIPFMDIYSTKPAKPDLFATTDITNEYDTIGDFPAYFNPLAIANALVAFPYTHPDQFYDNTDLNKYSDANAIPDKTQTEGNKTTYHYEDGTTKTVITNENNTKSTYYVVHTEHLPLLQPLRALTNPIGASFVLDAIEPTLRVFIDMAYDRETSPGTVKPFSFFTPPKNIIDALHKLPGAIEEGAENVQNGLPGAAPKQPAPVEKPASTPAPQADPPKSTPPAVQTPTPQAPAPILTLTTPEPATSPVQTKVPDPAAIAVSATAPGKPGVATATPATSGAASTPAQLTEAKPEVKPDATPDQKPTLTSVKDTSKPKNITKPTLRLPKLPASQPGTTPKTPKFPSLKDHLKSIPGLSEKRDTAPEASSKPAESTHTSTNSSTHVSEKGSNAA